MKLLFSLIKKEFLHIIRDYRSLVILVGIPIMQILIFGFALTNEVKNARIAIFDASKDSYTEGVIQKLDASQYFDIDTYISSISEVESVFRKGKVKLVVIFEPHFKENLVHLGKGKIQFIADASDPNTATTILNYAQLILADYQRQLNPTAKIPFNINIETKMLYNPQLKGEYNFVPGVMAMILMLISAMMTSVAIVREKELGTMEILLVSPMRPLWVIVSKMIPNLALSLLNFIIILLISVFVLGLPIRGSVPLLLSISLLYIACSLALGVVISTFSDSQQVALTVSLGGLMMPTILFSGFMFPIENLPRPMQIISNFVPAKWFFICIRQVMIKGLGFMSIWYEVLILFLMTLFFIGISVRNFKTRLA